MTPSPEVRALAEELLRDAESLKPDNVAVDPDELSALCRAVLDCYPSRKEDA